MKTNNELLADFLGYTKPHPEYVNTTYWYKESREPLAFLLFDVDWNWLMEVVEKINDLNNVVRISENHVVIVNNTRQEVLIESIYGSMFESTYNACVEFVKWYNEQKK
jgi:hypothetical protein